MSDAEDMIREAVRRIDWAKKFPFSWEFMSDFTPGQIICFNGKVGRLLDKGLNFIRVRYGSIVTCHYKPGTVTPVMEEIMIEEKQTKTKKEIAEEFNVSIGKVDYTLYGKNRFHMTYWTDEEDKILKDNRHKGTKWLSKRLGKKQWDINKRIKVLKLDRIRKRWSRINDDKFAEKYRTNTVARMAKMYKVSEISIRNRITILRDLGLITFKKGKTAHWTKEEEGTLVKRLTEDASYAEIADELGRSLSSIKSKIQRIYKRRKRKK